MYTWMSNPTRGSVLLACVFHATYDLTAILIGGVAPFSFRIHMGVLIVVAAIIVVLTGPNRLSRAPALETKEEAL
jgi:hypothetical protein